MQVNQKMKDDRTRLIDDFKLSQMFTAIHTILGGV
jgi:hypothetical protein